MYYICLCFIFFHDRESTFLMSTVFWLHQRYLLICGQIPSHVNIKAVALAPYNTHLLVLPLSEHVLTIHYFKYNFEETILFFWFLWLNFVSPLKHYLHSIETETTQNNLSTCRKTVGCKNCCHKRSGQATKFWKKKAKPYWTLSIFSEHK